MASSEGSALNNESGQAAMRPSERGEVPRPANPMWFPLGYGASVRQWWTAVTPKAAEYQVMSYVPYLKQPPQHLETTSAPGSKRNSTEADRLGPEGTQTLTTSSITDPYGPRSWSSSMVQLSGKDRALNEFSVSRDDEQVEDNLVLLHGYGAGLGFFYKNFEGLSRVNGWKLYALDMLGMGRSSRPNFRIHAKDPQGKITEAENWFVDALEEWRIARKLEKFTLLGHSMGGYMAVAYALKYPGRLNKLILASPVGIPEDPFAMQASMPEAGDSALANEFTQDQETDIVHGSPTKTEISNRSTLDKPPPRRQIPKWLAYAWDANISPFSLIRWAGPLGPRFVSGWTSRRFSHLPPEEAQALHNYSVSLFKQKGSGEYALAYILAPGAFARSPLIRRMAGLGRQALPPLDKSSNASPSIPESPTRHSPDASPAASTVARREQGLPVVFMYGSHDWMDKDGGRAAVRILEETTKRELEAAQKDTSTAGAAGSPQAQAHQDRGSARLVIIKDAGHHLYLDGWEDFNEVVRGEMREVSEARRRRASREAKEEGERER